MGYTWMIVPLLPIVAGIVLVIGFIGTIVSLIPTFQAAEAAGAEAAQALASIFALYGLAILTLYIVLLIGAFAIFYFLDRRNKHFKRQQMLFSSISSFFISRTSVVADSAGKLAELTEGSVFEEGDRPAGLWAIFYVFVTPIVGLVAAYNLTQDLHRHEERQQAFQATLASAFDEAGLQRPSFATARPHTRDPMVYLVLTAITAGLFWVYWFYTLVRDYNEHFKDQAMFEDQILATLKPSVVCKSCGASVPHNAKFCPLCGTAQSTS